jgi:ABC-type lipoprotein release transport system permease subunit
MLKLFLCLRYLRGTKIALLGVMAVALSVSLLTVADSILKGFVAGLKQACVWTEGDIWMFTGGPVPRCAVLLERLEGIDGVEWVGRHLSGAGLVRLGSGDVREVMIQAVDARYECRRKDLRRLLLRQSNGETSLSFDVPEHPNDIGGWVGINVIAEPNEYTDEYDLEQACKLIGRQVVLITSDRGRIEPPDSDASDTQTGLDRPRRRVLKFRMSDIYYSGIYPQDTTLYLPYDAFSRLSFGDEGPDCLYWVRIGVREGADAASVRDAVWQVWQAFAAQQLGWDEETISKARISTHQQIYEPMFDELSRQMGVLMLMLALICSVSVLLVFCIFYMAVQTRQKDMAIIKSCGSGSMSTAAVFLGFSMCVGIAGCGLGVFLGAVTLRHINALQRWVKAAFGLDVWRSSVFVFEKIPNELCWDSVLWMVPAAVCACVIGALVPAIIAARVQPVKILRYE